MCSRARRRRGARSSRAPPRGASAAGSPRRPGAPVQGKAHTLGLGPCVAYRAARRRVVADELQHRGGPVVREVRGRGGREDEPLDVQPRVVLLQPVQPQDTLGEVGDAHGRPARVPQVGDEAQPRPPARAGLGRAQRRRLARHLAQQDRKALEGLGLVARRRAPARVR
eukprot:scaffold91882_cov60-Phaeocystis_antarctica.AAC.2